MFPQQQPLDAELGPFRRIGPAGDMGPLAPLVIHGPDPVAVPFHQIEPGRHPQGFRRQIHRPGVDFLLFFVGRRQPAAFFIHPPVLDLAVHRIGVVGEFPLDPHHVGQPRTVDELVEHAGGDEGDVLFVIRYGFVPAVHDKTSLSFNDTQR